MSTNWSSPEVKSLFQITHFSNATTTPLNNLPSTTNGTSPAPTPSASASATGKTSVAGIAGGVVGGVLGCALVGGLSYFILKRRKASRAAAQAEADRANGGHGAPPKGPKGFHEMYQQPPELAGGQRDELRAELPEEAMFELDGGNHGGNRGFYEPPKEPIGTANLESDREAKAVEEPINDPEPFHEQVRQAVKKSIETPTSPPISRFNEEVSPIKSEVSPVLAPTQPDLSNKPTTKVKPQLDDQVSPIEGLVSPFTDDTSPFKASAGGEGSGKKSINKDLPPEPLRNAF